MPWGYKLVLFWGGLRGALALALALALPATLPERGEIVTVAFAVVSFSVLVQGLSMGWLVDRLGLRSKRVTVAVAPVSQLPGSTTQPVAPSTPPG